MFASPLRHRDPRSWLPWLPLVAGTVAVSAVLVMLGLPSPVLFGSLLAGMAYALTVRGQLFMAPIAFRVGQGLVGVVIGALVQVSTLSRLAADWPSGHPGTVGTLLISVTAGRLLSLHRDVSPATGAFALVAPRASWRRPASWVPTTRP